MSAQSVRSMVKQRDKSSLNVHANDWMDVLLPGVVVKSQSITEGAHPCKRAFTQIKARCLNPSQGLYMENKCPVH